jgi:hypothetical protein
MIYFVQSNTVWWGCALQAWVVDAISFLDLWITEL